MPSDDRPRIIEQDPDGTVFIRCGSIEIMAVLRWHGDDLHLDRFSIDGMEPNAIGLARVRELARQFMEDQGARRLIVQGTGRTTGAAPGKRPRAITFGRNG